MVKRTTAIAVGVAAAATSAALAAYVVMRRRTGSGGSDRQKKALSPAKRLEDYVGAVQQHPESADAWAGLGSSLLDLDLDALTMWSRGRCTHRPVRSVQLPTRQRPVNAEDALLEALRLCPQHARAWTGLVRLTSSTHRAVVIDEKPWSEKDCRRKGLADFAEYPPMAVELLSYVLGSGIQRPGVSFTVKMTPEQQEEHDKEKEDEEKQGELYKKYVLDTGVFFSPYDVAQHAMQTLDHPEHSLDGLTELLYLITVETPHRLFSKHGQGDDVEVLLLKEEDAFRVWDVIRERFPSGPSSDQLDVLSVCLPWSEPEQRATAFAAALKALDHLPATDEWCRPVRNQFWCRVVAYLLDRSSSANLIAIKREEAGSGETIEDGKGDAVAAAPTTTSVAIQQAITAAFAEVDGRLADATAAGLPTTAERARRFLLVQQVSKSVGAFCLRNAVPPEDVQGPLGWCRVGLEADPTDSLLWRTLAEALWAQDLQEHPSANGPVSTIDVKLTSSPYAPHHDDAGGVTSINSIEAIRRALSNASTRMDYYWSVNTLCLMADGTDPPLRFGSLEISILELLRGAVLHRTSPASLSNLGNCMEQMQPMVAEGATEPNLTVDLFISQPCDAYDCFAHALNIGEAPEARIQILRLRPETDPLPLPGNATTSRAQCVAAVLDKGDKSAKQTLAVLREWSRAGVSQEQVNDGYQFAINTVGIDQRPSRCEALCRLAAATADPATSYKLKPRAGLCDERVEMTRLDLFRQALEEMAALPERQRQRLATGPSEAWEGLAMSLEEEGQTVTVGGATYDREQCFLEASSGMARGNTSILVGLGGEGRGADPVPAASEPAAPAAVDEVVGTEAETPAAAAEDGAAGEERSREDGSDE